MATKKPWEEPSGEPIKKAKPAPRKKKETAPPPEPEQHEASDADLIEGHDPHMLRMVAEWYQVSADLRALKVREMELRNRITEKYYPTFEKGTHYREMPDNWKLKGVFKYNITVDVGALPAVLEHLPEGTEDKVINYKPELRLKEYNALLENHRKILEQALVIKPGTPSLELIPPKVAN